jgi:hypothetical protein
MSKLDTMIDIINDDEYIIKCINYLKSLPKLYSCKDVNVRKYSEYFDYFKDCIQDKSIILDKEYILNKFCYDILDNSSSSSSSGEQSDDEYYIMNTKKTKTEKEKLKKIIRIVHFQKFAHFLKDVYDFDIDDDVKLWYPASFNKSRLSDFIIQLLNKITYTLKKTDKGIVWYDTYYCNAYIDFDDIFSDKFSILLRHKMLNLNDEELNDIYINNGCLK